MKILCYSTKDFEHPFLRTAGKDLYTVEFVQPALSAETVYLSKGYDCVSVFTADDVSRGIVEKLYENGVRFIAVRAAGYDNIDIVRATELGIRIANVPAYSPHAIAEFAVLMMLAMSRKLIEANAQVHHLNFTLDKLVGFNLHQKTVGIIGTGKIGAIVAGIMHGFGCRLLGYDVVQSTELKEKCQLEYTSLERLCNESDIITIHTPLNSQTKYLINHDTLTEMKKGVMIINTARGAVVNTVELSEFLEKGRVGYYGMDVYEKEKGIFFFDHTGKELNDPVLKKLIAIPNVLVTPHQAFATYEALTNIADTTFYNISCWAENTVSENELCQRKSKEHF
jgi:D-lactate dehydrogenase